MNSKALNVPNSNSKEKKIRTPPFLFDARCRSSGGAVKIHFGWSTFAKGVAVLAPFAPFARGLMMDAWAQLSAFVIFGKPTIEEKPHLSRRACLKIKSNNG